VIAQLFEPAAVARLLDDHRDGRGNFTRELRALAAVALWANQALEGQTP